jgi:phenylpropionate dioxygenase-like ring-hydroxylating dioxygenase large terminal subunit
MEENRVNQAATGTQLPDAPPARFIPKERYTSEEYLRAELQHLWPRVWLVAGLSSDLPAAGSYCTFDLGVESLLVVRQEQGVRAFHNVCRHRGRRLRESGMGRARSFQCPYHGWEYHADGRLKCVSDPDSFPQGLAADALGLKRVACAEWAGFVWVNLASDPPPLHEYLGPVAPLIEAYRLEDCALVEDLTLDMPCNWKVCVDAFNEAYHLKCVHPEILGLVDDVNVRTDLLGRHGRLIVPFFTPSPRKHDRHTIDQGLRRLLEEARLPPSEITGSALEMRRKIQQRIRAREQAGELDCSRLSDDQLSDSNHFHIFPNFQLDLYSLTVLTLRARPHPTDPNRMLLDQQRFERLPKGRNRPQRPVHTRFPYGKGSLGAVTDQDMYNLVRVQVGMRSSGFDGLVLSDQELLISHLHRMLDTFVPWPRRV